MAGDRSDDTSAGDGRGGIGFRHREQMTPPRPDQVSKVAITRFEHVYEVDPRLMDRWVLQQAFPNWDTLRIMHSRHGHLDWMHRHFAERVVSGSEILTAIDAEATGADTETETGSDH
jgi:RPA family protein